MSGHKVSLSAVLKRSLSNPVLKVALSYGHAIYITAETG